MDINAVAAKLLLIFLLGVAIWFILGKIEILEGSILRDVFAGAISVVLAEVLLTMQIHGRKNDESLFGN